MATTFANGTLTMSKTMTATLAQRLINGVLVANGVSTTREDGVAMTNAEKMAAFDDWFWRYLRNDAKSWEARRAAMAAAETADTELP